jgi:hypothetical protein
MSDEVATRSGEQIDHTRAIDLGLGRITRAGGSMARSLHPRSALSLGLVLSVLVAYACSASQERDNSVGSGGQGQGGSSGSNGSGGLGAIGGSAGAGGLGGLGGLDGGNSGCETSISGVVYDPAGKVPLYNVVVYVPGEALGEIPTGASCQTCNGFFTGKPKAVALSGPDGAFKLVGAPAAADVPLVIQIGKWRRQITVPTVTACADTPLTDREQTRLPRNQSEGHIPKIAIATGGSDALECLVRKMGVSDSEFTTEKGTGRVNLFAGYRAATTMGGQTLTTADTLWSTPSLLDGYDMMLMSCEGSDNVSRTAAQYAAVRGFADKGGRIFGSHWHHGWINPENQPYPEVVRFSSGAHGFEPPENPITVSIDTSFDKGKAFSQWLLHVGASSTAGQIGIKGAEHSVDSVVPGVAQQWIFGTDPQNNKPMVQYFSFNTPVGQAECGRMVFSDVHVSAGAGTDSGKVPFPTGCTSQDLSPQEKALAFMIFDLSSCVQPDKDPVKPPPIPQ